MRNIFLSIFLFIAGYSFSQTIQQPDNSPSLALPLQKVYFTTDKEIYAPNEQLWFSAYLFDNSTLLRDTATVLTIGLYDALSEKMVVLKKFLIENHIATGNMLLPDSLFPGDYTLVAYTNLVDATNKPITTNFKPLRIYSRKGDKPFTTSLKVVDSLSSADRIAVLHEMSPESYQIAFRDVKAFYRLGVEKNKRLQLNTSGEGVMYINTKDINPFNHNVVVATIYNGDTVHARIQLPIPNELIKKYTAILNPEGGALIADYQNKVFVEFLKKNIVGSFKSVLLENGTPLDTLHSKANEQNFFTVEPKANHQYTVSVNFGDSIIQYQLPEVIKNGVKISLPQVVVNDTLRFELLAKEKRALQLVIIDLNGTPFVHHFNMNGAEKMAISLDGFSRGLCKLLILDEGNKLLANTYFFAHYYDSTKAILQTSKRTYNTRDSIDLNLYVVGANDTLQNAIATISCTLLSRVNLASQKNIETDFVLNGLAYNEQAVYQKREMLDNKLLLENILRLKGGYNNDTVIDYNNIGQAMLSKPKVVLNITQYDKKVKQEVDWVLFQDMKLLMLKSDKKGALKLDFENLIIPDGRNLFLRRTGKQNDGYAFSIDDALIKTCQHIKIPIYQPVYREQPTDIASALVTDKTEKFSRTLEAVVIKSKKDVGLERTERYGSTNPCGDYVCEYNVLNCLNHTVPYKWPKKGEIYRNNTTRIQTIYNGCEQEGNYQDYLPVASTTPIYLPREFLGMDSALLRQEFREYLSTICWKPFTRIFKSRQNKIVFNSSDQKGTYLITVQGFAENGQPFFAQKTITVRD